MQILKNLFTQLNTQENRSALALALILLALVIFTAESAPTWIYQGF